MRRTATLLGVGLAAALLAGCAAVQSLGPAGAVGGRSRAAEPGPIERRYTLESLLHAVLQLDWFTMSAPTFFQMVETGDWTFQDYLISLFAVEDSPYRPGQGTRLVSRQGRQAPFFTLEKALLEVDGNGAWWQVVQGTEFGELVYEVLVSPERVPILLRYIEPATGIGHEIRTEVGYDLEHARVRLTPQQLRERLDRELEEQIAESWSHAFGSPILVGEEVVRSAAGTFTAVHVRDQRAGNPPGITDYWLSPDVPGKLLRAETRIPGSDVVVVTELVALLDQVRRRIDPEGIIR